ncbi:MAG: hypothetical protein P1U89_17875 [Verrucomicrobiales bacterium]|nr:hypothetical protein [Verrucomicrobiales bacterium]
MDSTQTSSSWTYESNWLSGKSFDTLFIFGILAIAVLSGVVAWNEPNLFPLILFLDLWFLGYHHVISTFTKLAGTAQDRKDNRFLILYLPFIVVAAVALLATGVGLWSVVTVYFFWQWYHYTRQSYGISAFYRRKSQHSTFENPKISQAILWSIPIWGLLHRCSQGWNLFLFQEVWLPAIPSFVATGAGLISVGLLLYWLTDRAVAFRNGTLPLGHTLYMASHFSAFFVGYVLIPDINIGWLVANIWHNAQYILFVWLYNTKRFEKPEMRVKSVLGWASQIKPVRVLAYFSGCLIITTVVYKGITTSLNLALSYEGALLTTMYVITFQTINFHHYVVDSLIWKARKKANQKVMLGHASVPKSSKNLKTDRGLASKKQPAGE